MEQARNKMEYPEASPITPVAATEQEWWCIDFGQAQVISQQTMDELTESFFRFTPDVVQGRNRIFLEMSRTKKLLNLNTFSNRARVLGSRVGAEIMVWRFGIAKSIPKAWVQTRYRSIDSLQLPLEAYFDFINPLQHFEMNRAMNERLSVFRALGMKCLESLFTIPKSAWLVRFGEEFDSFLENYEFGENFVWSCFVPTIPLQEQTRWNAEDYVIDSESLIFRLKPLTDKLLQRLYSLRKALKKMVIVLKLDRPVPDRRIELTFAFPQTSPTLLIKLLREKLAHEMQKQPLTDPIVFAEISILETVNREHQNSRFAFSEKDEATEGEQDRWLELVSYLELKFQGGAEVFQAETTDHLLPERSWKKILLPTPHKNKALDTVSHLYAQRPVQLFSVPAPIFRVGHFLKQENQLWRICEFTQEERLSGYDWDVEETGGFERTYFRVKVKNEAGVTQSWWIFKDERAGSLQLHGVY